jgi:hypothetical protein
MTQARKVLVAFWITEGLRDVLHAYQVPRGAAGTRM